ncbi:hypothetical protein [Rhizobium sp. FKY42]|uniref:hypothetical protein n=1 Tax=Rhizobium sp. FKY42 TaxID=2562310 RepID=UPI0010C01A5F|nr:hypothetical protein [Rhizobium sp. FKY42]
MKQEFCAAVGLAVLAMSPVPAHAEDASWGCQVLLCAASQSPSWHGVPYCVPPMKKLIAAIAKPGFSWPVCHEAKAGEPGFEPYEECPAGMTAVSSRTDSDRPGFGSENLDQCTKTENQCSNRAAFRTQFGDARENKQRGVTITPLNQNNDNQWNPDNGCMVQITQPRPRRSEPYFFDIPNEQGVSQRAWFNLDY